MLEKTERYWIDRETGNCWTFEFAAEEEQAAAFAATLTNCADCSDCVNCTSCTECTKCSGCNKCTACDTCVNCVGCTDCDCCIDCEQCSQCLGCRSCEECIDCADCKACLRCTSCAGSSHSTACVSCWRLYCCFNCIDCVDAHMLTDAAENPMRVTGPVKLPKLEQITLYAFKNGRMRFVHTLARSEDKDVFLAELERKHVDTAPIQVFLHEVLPVCQGC